MIYLKKNCVAFFIIAASCISYAHTDEVDDELLENIDYSNCITNLKNQFGPNTSPIGCIKIAIMDMLNVDTFNADVENYYKLFSRKVNPKGIKNQSDMCTEILGDTQSVEYEDNHAKCVKELNLFGFTEDRILESAIYIHRHGSVGWKSCFIHEENSNGYKYLKHIVNAFELKENAYLPDQKTFCKETYFPIITMDDKPKVPNLLSSSSTKVQKFKNYLSGKYPTISEDKE